MLGVFPKVVGVLPTTQFVHRKWLGTCGELLCVSHTLQSALEGGQESRIVQIDFSAAFDRVNRRGILYKLGFVGIGVCVLSLLTQFLSNRSNHFLMDGWQSKLVTVVAVILQRRILVSLLFLLF